MAKKAKGGKKHRKFGRWSRGNSMKMYVLSDRCSINKEKRRKRHLKRVEKKRLKLARRVS